jgi:hypothetical protein
MMFRKPRSLAHVKNGTKDKKVLLAVTDGEDNVSRNSLERTVREIQKTDVVIYSIGLLSQENKKNAKNARKALRSIAEASGGLAFFPKNVRMHTKFANRWRITSEISTPLRTTRPTPSTTELPHREWTYSQSAGANLPRAHATAATPRVL